MFLQINGYNIDSLRLILSISLFRDLMEIKDLNLSIHYIFSLKRYRENINLRA